MKTLKLFFLIVTCCGLFFINNAMAAVSPLPMLQSTSDQMINALRQNQSSLQSNPQLVYGFTTHILLPHVDINGMARSVLGRNGWAQATPAQRAQFTQEFTTLLVHTYSGAFAKYSNQTVQFQPIRGIAGNRVQVNSLILQPGGPSISVQYRLVLQGGQWKVYDFSVDGVSMIESFRNQFAQQLNQGGMPMLLQALRQHNQATR